MAARGGAALYADRVGVGLKPSHVESILARPGRVGWFEVHAENYMGPGGPPHRQLEAVRRDHPLSIHGVGLSLGGETPPDPDQLGRLSRLIARYEPFLVSEHLAWSEADGIWLNDLLPVPYDEPTLRRVAEHVDRTQDALGRRLLVENPSRYHGFAADRMAEGDFLAALAARTGCGVLLDVNNVVVSAHNLGLDPLAELARMPVAAVGEIHLAGHREVALDDGPFRIDDHGSAVVAETWSLFAEAIGRVGATPTLIEWDTRVPSFDRLVAEARKAAGAIAAATAEVRARVA
ncbi:MAG: DUF692 family multinuclear iron-containing protein [Alphaproteobacteria bacterium]